MPNPKVALIVGAAPGLGAALGRRFSAADAIQNCPVLAGAGHWLNCAPR